MATDENKYKELFQAEAYDIHEELNRLLTILEKQPQDQDAIESIFRLTHTLKGNAQGLGLSAIAEVSHIIEDIFVEIKKGTAAANDHLFQSLFRANDKLGELIEAIKTNKKVSYKGILTKLTVFYNKISSTETTPLTTSDSATTKKDDDSESNEESFERSPQVAGTQISFSDQVQIPIKKLDHLLSLAGELTIEKDSLITQDSHRRHHKYSRLHRITSDLQHAIMDARLVQIGFFFNKFHRVARDAAKIEGKQIDLHLKGTDIEIDRNVLKTISDSLVHLIRNAIGHGIESPEERIKLGKSEIGTITLSAKNEKDGVTVTIEDDGQGIDTEKITKKAIKKGIISEEMVKLLSADDKLHIIFEAGFSNADSVNQISGRGIGMDVVKKAVESINGRIAINTNIGKGTEISLALPTSMIVKAVLLFKIANQEYAVPLTQAEAVISLTKDEIHPFSGGLMAQYLEHTISIVLLKDIFKAENIKAYKNEITPLNDIQQLSPEQKLEVLVVRHHNRLLGLIVDKLLQQQEIVEKRLAPPINQISLFSGATILGNGNICLVLDVAYVLRELFQTQELYPSQPK